MSEDDLLGSGAREPLRSCCVKLAARLWAVCQPPAGATDDIQGLQVGLQAPPQVLRTCVRRPCASSDGARNRSPRPTPSQRAVVALRGAANTEAAAGEGRLDGALRQLAQALDPSFEGSRMDAVELLTATLQVPSWVAGIACSGSRTACTSRALHSPHTAFATPRHSCAARRAGGCHAGGGTRGRGGGGRWGGHG